jgi:sigma-B regulation protein RsbU (phosphoserine phosphatase)
MMDDRRLTLSLSANLLTPLHAFDIIVLLIDDQMIIAEAVKRLLSDQSDIFFHYCPDPSKALATAMLVKPTVILQDLVMPEVDGLLLVKYFRANPATRDIPIIVLSVKEDPQIKAEAFALGANDYVIKLPDRLELIARIRYHSNAYIRLLERNEVFKKLEESQKILQKELADAAAYVQSLLPEPIKNHVAVDWRYIPSMQLGGDAFGYHWLDERYFAIYLLDVCGHGVGAALHSISIINILRSHNLPRANFHDPSSVLKELNHAFQMEDHNNMFFTIWYGVFDKETKQIIYSSGGHPPAILLTGKSAESAKCYELKTRGIVIGAFPEADFENAMCQVEEFNRLFVFSDGVYEIPKSDGSIMNFHEFKDLLLKTPRRKGSELDYILQFIQNIQGKTIFGDDFSLLQVIFGNFING